MSFAGRQDTVGGNDDGTNCSYRQQQPAANQRISTFWNHSCI